MTNMHDKDLFSYYFLVIVVLVCIKNMIKIFFIMKLCNSSTSNDNNILWLSLLFCNVFCSKNKLNSGHGYRLTAN